MGSLLMFLTAINGRYTEEDFIQELPRRLVLGSNFLLFAVVTAMVAFNAALSMLMKRGTVTLIFFSLYLFPIFILGSFQFHELKAIYHKKY
jgi:hypothetical protein